MNEPTVRIDNRMLQPHPEPAPTAAGLEQRRAAWQEAYSEFKATEAEIRFLSNLSVRWSHHSTAIEGNRLSYRETALLLLFGETPGGHRVRDLDEVRGHAEAVATVVQWARTRHRPTPGELRELHRQAMFRPHWKGEGRHRHWIETGEYKQVPNYVRQLDGRIKRFAEPESVPQLMEQFARNYNNLADSVQANPARHDVAAVLTKVHQEFINIHPFDDGNGRMVRLLTGHMALLCGCVPPIIELAERDAYMRAIPQADAGDERPLRDLFARTLGRGLDFGLAVAAGKADPSWSNEHGNPELAPQGDNR